MTWDVCVEAVTCPQRKKSKQSARTRGAMARRCAPWPPASLPSFPNPGPPYYHTHLLVLSLQLPARAVGFYNLRFNGGEAGQVLGALCSGVLELGAVVLQQIHGRRQVVA